MIALLIPTRMAKSRRLRHGKGMDRKQGLIFLQYQDFHTWRGQLSAYTRKWAKRWMALPSGK